MTDDNDDGHVVKDEPAAADPERREPIKMSTLPSSYTLSLDSLSEGQRRRRHRHIPNVDGFWKLYNREESKEDLSAARRFKCRVAAQQ